MCYCNAMDSQHFGLLNPDPQKYVDQPKTAKKKSIALITQIWTVEKWKITKRVLISEWFIQVFAKKSEK